jgi:hypothetical protein
MKRPHRRRRDQRTLSPEVDESSAAVVTRGTLVQFGSLQGERSISAHAQLSATANRLRDAQRSNDANEMLAALQAAEVLRPQVADFPNDLGETSFLIRQRLESDTQLRKQGALRRAKPIRREVRRIWDLMVAESNDGATPSSEVTREGYREIHHRVAKVLMGDEYSDAKAAALADKDWAEDISRFTGETHITVWLGMIRDRFKQGAAESVARQGFEALFKRYDEDGNGELDLGEFFQAVRNDLGMPTGAVFSPRRVMAGSLVNRRRPF